MTNSHRQALTRKNCDTWVSAAGDMNFANADEKDSFNVIFIDTEANTFQKQV